MVRTKWFDWWDVLLLFFFLVAFVIYIHHGGTRTDLYKSLAESGIDAIIGGLIVSRLIKKSKG